MEIYKTEEIARASVCFPERDCDGFCRVNSSCSGLSRCNIGYIMERAPKGTYAMCGPYGCCECYVEKHEPSRYFVDEPQIWVCVATFERDGIPIEEIGVGFDEYDAMDDAEPNLTVWQYNTEYRSMSCGDYWAAAAFIEAEGDKTADMELLMNADAETMQTATDAIEMALGPMYAGCYDGLDESQPAIKSMVDYGLARVIAANNPYLAAERWRWLFKKAADELDEIGFYL